MVGWEETEGRVVAGVREGLERLDGELVGGGAGESVGDKYRRTLRETLCGGDDWEVRGGMG